MSFGKYSVDEKGNQTTGNGQYCAHLRLSCRVIGSEPRAMEPQFSQRDGHQVADQLVSGSMIGAVVLNES